LRAARSIALYAAAVVLIGSLLAPWAFLAVQQWGGPLAVHPFRRVYDRVLLIVALAGLWPLLRALGLRHWRDVGYGRSPGMWRDLGAGSLLGIGSLGLAAALLLVLDARTCRAIESGALLARLGGAALTGIVVALIEETFFRGGVQNALQRGMRPGVAVAVASAIYSALHFLKPKGINIPAEAITWFSGVDYLGQVLIHSARAAGLWRGFVTLWLAGMVLGWAFVWTRHLYLSIGLHAGWVFLLKLFTWATVATGRAEWWSEGTLVDNVVVWPVMLGLLVLIRGRSRPRQDA